MVLPDAQTFGDGVLQLTNRLNEIRRMYYVRT